jgi:hypothetical protein
MPVCPDRQEGATMKRASASRALLLGAAIGVGLAFGAAAGELGFPASALEEFARKERAPSFDAAPPLAPPIATGSIAAPSAIVAPAPSPAPAEPATPAEEPASPAPSPSAPSTPPTKPVARPAPRPPAQETTTTGLDEYEARCFVKIDGKVVVARGCRILRDGGKSVVFEIEDGPLTIDLRQGRVWTARLKERDFGNVYKTGECWGATGFYACDRGRK